MGGWSTTDRRSPGPAAREAPPRARRRTVLLDTNALFLPVRTRFPLLQEIDRLAPGARVAVPTSVMAELERLARRTVPHAAAARALAERLPGVDSSGRGDDAVIGTATRLGAWVVTSDDELQHRLRDLGVTVLAPRDRHRLELAPGRPAKLGNR